MTASGSSCSSRNRRSAARPASRRASSCSRLTNPSFDQAASNDLVELRLGHDVAPGVALVELLDRLVERGAVDERVVRRERHAQDVGVLVLERAGQVVVDLVEAQRQRLLDRARRGPPAAGCGARRPRAARAARRRRRAGAGHARRDRQVQRLEHERRDAPGPRAAVVRGVGQDQLVPGPGHRRRRTGGAPPGAAAPPSAASPRPSPAGSASGSPRPIAGKRPATSPGRKTTGNSRPFALWTVRTATASASGSRSAVAGSSPASMSVCEVARDEDRPVVGEERRLARGRCRRSGRCWRAPPRRPTVSVAGEPREQPAAAQERVQHLAGRSLVGQLGVAAQVRDEPWTAVARSPGARRRIPGWRVQLLEDLPAPTGSAGAPC